MRGFGVGAHHHPGQPAPPSATVAREQRIRQPQQRLSTSKLSSRAFGLGTSNDGAASDPKSCVTLLTALPAIGHAFGPADAAGTAVRKHLDPNVSAVYENRPQSRVFPESLETGLECRHRIYRSDVFLAGAGLARARPSSAMSPAGYSLASLSSKRLRFADRLISWARSGI